MYTGQSINPTVNHYAHKQTATPRPQVGFAIIPVSQQNKPQQTTATQQEIQHSDIQRIVEMLNKNPVGDNKPAQDIQKPSVDIQHNQSSESISDKTLSAFLTAISVITGGVLLNKILNTPSEAQRKYLLEKQRTDDIIKAVPSLVQATATGIAMIAGTVGAIGWLNQKTPDQLRAEYDILSKR